jgi:demethylmenaquinone methyltransferase/2-methoxy-6-polyprenyl-1,4-benzoquinol methylase
MPTILEKSQYSGNISSLYSRLACMYDLFTDHELPHHREAIEMAQIDPREAILEVACGTGRATLEIARQIATGNKLFAVDLTEAMIQKAKKKLEREGLLNKVEFKPADAKALPFPDSSFNMLYNAYMFDLIDLSEIPEILSEFKRVLKPGGRLVLVNMSKNTDTKTLYEVLYEKGLLSFATGSCRPVLLEEYLKEASFQKVQRFYRKNHSWFPLNWLHGTELVIAHKQ